ncbi:MAG: SsrA-binding protein SmpB [Fimbriimonadaceae bacterium]|nr:SsrA-binding protein SmpB [Fimbriimonadaceae bacterium]
MAKKSKNAEPRGPATITNRRAGHEYFFLETWEAGLVLQGSEVKSVYAGRADLSDAYVRIRDGEVWLFNLDIEPYSHASAFRPDRRRDRKLLLHRKEIRLIQKRSEQKGLALIPTRLYFKGRRAKVAVALAQGKKLHDKRETIKERDLEREARRNLD